MKRSLIAGMSAAAIAATALVAPQAVHAADPAPVVQSGSVETPIKDSFLGYIQGFAKGEIHVSEGAEKVLNGEKTKAFKLPVNADDTKLDANGNGTIELDGKIQFYGHKGLGANGGWGLDLNFSDIKLKVDGKKMQMLADYVSVGELPGGEGSKNSPADDALIAEYELVAPIKPEAGKEFDFKVNKGRLKDGGFDAFIAYSEQYKPEADAFGGTLKFAEKKKEEPTNTSKPEEPTNTSKPEEPTNTSKPEEPTNTSKPEEPTNTSKPAEPTNTSKPEEPTNTSKPAEPTNTSKPAEPTNTSKPAEPTNTSKPAEPTNTSKPAEPTSTSKPAEPTNTSKPAKPTNTSKPAKPTNTSKPAKPTNTSKPAEPTNTSKPAEPTNTSKPAEPTNTSKPAEPTNTSKPAPNAGSSEKAKTAGIVIGVLAALAAIIGIIGFINSGALDSIMRQFRGALDSIMRQFR
ncbi:HtaA domain-containing protein [Corynebacterium aquatimens]|uniref:HtaA domain-containing protein n=1 Tax=Corynebacterium aquatimens TaxID=1190508 RepID=UPI00360B1C8B